MLCVLCLASCRNGKDNKAEITRLVAEWQGKEILFPPNPVFTLYGKDTVDWEVPQTDFKILVYVDSIGCTSCKLQLPKWGKWIKEMDSIAPGRVSFLVFFQSKDIKEIRYILRRDKFNFPVCVDIEDELDRKNHFPSNGNFQTFLLDRTNKVVVIGNPIHNIAIKELYIKQITRGGSPVGNSMQTTASVSEPEINLGIFPVSTTKRAVFTLVNTGDQPLVILDTSTTCGCAAVSFDKEPASPGSSVKVTIDMTPKATGFFDETITVKCNTEKQMKLKIRGQAN